VNIQILVQGETFDFCFNDSFVFHGIKYFDFMIDNTTEFEKIQEKEILVFSRFQGAEKEQEKSYDVLIANINLKKAYRMIYITKEELENHFLYVTARSYIYDKYKIGDRGGALLLSSENFIENLIR